MTFKKLCLLLAFFLSSNVNAALLVNDWNAVGDDAITFDSESNLWWLDLTETAGMSYRQVSSELGVGSRFEGWRYASVAEARNLYLQFGIPALAGNSLPIDTVTAAIDTMNSYLGNIMATNGDGTTHSGNWAITGTEYDVSYPDWHIMFLAYTHGSGTASTIDLGIAEWAADLDMSWPYAGSLLVSSEDLSLAAVPVPATLFLLAPALLVLLGRRRKMVLVASKS